MYPGEPAGRQPPELTQVHNLKDENEGQAKLSPRASGASEFMCRWWKLRLRYPKKSAPPRTYFVSDFAFLILAQRAFCAAAIFARPSALKRRRLRAGFALLAAKGKAVADFVAFRPRFTGTAPCPIRSTRA